MDSSGSRRWKAVLVLFLVLTSVLSACGLLNPAGDELVDELIDESNQQRTQEAEADTSVDEDLLQAAINGIDLVDPIDDFVPECARDAEPVPSAGPPWADVTRVQQPGPNEFWIEFDDDLQSIVEGNDGNPVDTLDTVNVTLIVTTPDGETVEYRKEWWGYGGGGSEEHPPSGSSPEAEGRYSPTFVFIDEHTLRIKLLGEEDLPEGTQIHVSVLVRGGGEVSSYSCDRVGE
jgi:hypothetical protein